MNENEREMLYETAQLARSNSEAIKEIRSEQYAIHKLATAVQVMAEKISNIELAVKETNDKLERNNEHWQETEQKLNDKIQYNEIAPMIESKKDMHAVKVAVISSAISFVVTGVISFIVSYFIK